MTYKYDLAISLLQKDETLAHQIYKPLSGSYNVFLYTENQKELAGTDGEVTFRNVFFSESRFVLVLFRPGWGETHWSRVEEQAIRDRTGDEGYDFFKLLMLDGEMTPPPWVPKQQIWINYERFGLDKTVAILDARLQEAGATPKIQTPETIARKIKEQHDFKQKRDELRRAQVSMDLFKGSFEKVLLLLEMKSLNVQAANPRLRIHIEKDSRHIHLDLYQFKTSLTLLYEWSNALDDKSCIEMVIGKRRSLSQGYSSKGNFSLLEKDCFFFDFLKDGNWYWVSEKTGDAHSSKSLCDHILIKSLRYLNA